MLQTTLIRLKQQDIVMLHRDLLTARHVHRKQPFHATLCTHCSVDRLPHVFKQLRLWGRENPASISLFIRQPCEEAEAVAKIQEFINQQEPEHMTVSAVHAAQRGCSPSLYPFNAMRNTAVQHATTDVILFSEGDYLPSHGLPNLAHELGSQLVHEASQSRPHPPQIMFVVPVFEVEGEKLEGMHGGMEGQPPWTQAQLRTLPGVRPFHCGLYPPAQPPYSQDLWWSAKEPIEATYSEYWEPMGIVYKHALPPWDERFTGHGLNKVQHGYHMAALGFKFMVVPGEFFATMSHKRSRSYTATSGPEYEQRARVEALYKQFKGELCEQGPGPVLSW